MKRYFYITVHFSPDYEGTVFSKHQDDLCMNTETGDYMIALTSLKTKISKAEFNKLLIEKVPITTNFIYDRSRYLCGEKPYVKMKLK